MPTEGDYPDHKIYEISSSFSYAVLNYTSQHWLTTSKQ